MWFFFVFKEEKRIITSMQEYKNNYFVIMFSLILKRNFNIHFIICVLLDFTYSWNDCEI